MNIDRIILMLVSGTICVYKIAEYENAILEKIIEASNIKDSNGQKL